MSDLRKSPDESSESPNLLAEPNLLELDNTPGSDTLLPNRRKSLDTAPQTRRKSLDTATQTLSQPHFSNLPEVFDQNASVGKEKGTDDHAKKTEKKRKGSDLRRNKEDLVDLRQGQEDQTKTGDLQKDIGDADEHGLVGDQEDDEGDNIVPPGDDQELEGIINISDKEDLPKSDEDVIDSSDKEESLLVRRIRNDTRFRNKPRLQRHRLKARIRGKELAEIVLPGDVDSSDIEINNHIYKHRGRPVPRFNQSPERRPKKRWERADKSFETLEIRSPNTSCCNKINAASGRPR